MTFEKHLEAISELGYLYDNYTGIRKGIIGKRKKKHKGIEEGAYLACLRKSKMESALLESSEVIGELWPESAQIM